MKADLPPSPARRMDDPKEAAAGHKGDAGSGTASLPFPISLESPTGIEKAQDARWLEVNSVASPSLINVLKMMEKKSRDHTI